MKAVSVIIAGTVAAFAVCEAVASKGKLSGEPDVLLVLGCRVRGDKAEETVNFICTLAFFLRDFEFKIQSIFLMLFVQIFPKLVCLVVIEFEHQNQYNRSPRTPKLYL